MREDYYNGSVGSFNPVCKRWVEKILHGCELKIVCTYTGKVPGERDEYSVASVLNLPEDIVLGNHKWTLIHVSVNGYFGSASIYYRSGEYILRISDHWSDGNLAGNHCGHIRKCWWALKGNTTQGTALSGSNKLFQGGIVKMSSLEYR